MPSSNPPDTWHDLLITPGVDSPVPPDDFRDTHDLIGAEPVIRFHVETSYNPNAPSSPSPTTTPTGPTITDVDHSVTGGPVVTVYRKESHDNFFTLSHPDSGYVFFALRSQAGLTPTLMQLVTKLDDDYDGIKDIHSIVTDDDSASIQSGLELLADQLTDSNPTTHTPDDF